MDELSTPKGAFEHLDVPIEGPGGAAGRVA